MRAIIERELSTALPSILVAELLDAHGEANRNLSLGGFRLGSVEGGRFCEAALRLLEYITKGTFTPIGTQLDSERIIVQLGQLPIGSHPDAIRLHIPRGLRLVYDIRNKRDIAHLGDGIDPNLQDSMLVAAVIDWVVAEFLRLYHGITPAEAQAIVTKLATRSVPVIQDFDGFLKVLNPSLSASDYCLVLLCHRGQAGATYKELVNWVRDAMKANLGRTLNRLVDEKAFIHRKDDRYFITRAGELSIEARNLLNPIA